MTKSKNKFNAFTHAGGHSPLLYGDEVTQGSPIKSLSLRERVVAVARQGLTATGEGANAFTLAEILITLGVIGVVAAVTMPTLLTNIQDRVRQEQVRTVKYKLTKAIDTMNSLGKIGPYGSDAGNVDATEKFVDELKKHMSIAKICKSTELDKCWPAGSVNGYLGTNSTTLTSNAISTMSKGSDINALALSSGNTRLVGLVTGDGVPMIMVYSPVCQALDETKNYTWSVENGKPVTNATTNCISAIFDINGAKGPNRVGQDIRTLNSLFGSIDLGAVSVSKSECEAMIKNSKYGVKECGVDTDYWAGGVKKCADMGLHLPDMMTLANIANSRYGTTLIGAYTIYMGPSYGDNCQAQILTWDSNDPYRINKSDAIICNANTTPDSSSGFSITGRYWSSSEHSSTGAYYRYFGDNYSSWARNYSRSNSDVKSLCVGD